MFTLFLKVWKQTADNHKCHQIKCTSWVAVSKPDSFRTRTSHPTQQGTRWFTGCRLRNAQCDKYAQRLNTNMQIQSCVREYKHLCSHIKKQATVQYKTPRGNKHAHVQKVSTETLFRNIQVSGQHTSHSGSVPITIRELCDFVSLTGAFDGTLQVVLSADRTHVWSVQ